MFTLARKMIWCLVISGASIFALGCQSSNPRLASQQSASASQVPDQVAKAVTCSKCKVTWVKYPITPGGGKSHRIIGYGARKSMECPDCRSAVENFFTTGQLRHTCATCGDAIEVC